METAWMGGATLIEVCLWSFWLFFHNVLLLFLLLPGDSNNQNTTTEAPFVTSERFQETGCDITQTRCQLVA